MLCKKTASVIWMLCRKTGYFKMEKIQYKALKIVFNSNQYFEDLILHKNEVSIHEKQSCHLTTEIYKSLADLSSEFIKPFFYKVLYNLGNGHVLNLPLARTNFYGTNSILFRACQVWNKLPISIKQSQSPLEFKTNIKTLRNTGAQLVGDGLCIPLRGNAVCNLSIFS